MIVAVPVPLTGAAFVNAVVTATEAKVQAVLDAGFAGTGTATDADLRRRAGSVPGGKRSSPGRVRPGGPGSPGPCTPPSAPGADGYAATLKGRTQ